MNVRIVVHEQIDKEKWDRINGAENRKASVYNSTAYLDALSPGWDAIVVNDYEAFTALPKKAKMGLTVYGNPPFLQKLSIIGDRSEANAAAIGRIIGQLKLTHLSFDEAYFGYAKPRIRNNFYIDLSATYETIAANYKSGGKASVKKAGMCGLRVVRLDDYRLTFDGFGESFSEVSSYKPAHFEQLAFFLDSQPDMFDCYGVLNEAGEVVFSAIILKDAFRYYYLVSGARPQYRHLYPTYFFMDWFLQQHAGEKGRIFDFEGSDIPSVAFYFQRYGPETEHYYTYYRNNYFFPLKQLLDKKLKQ